MNEEHPLELGPAVKGSDQVDREQEERVQALFTSLRLYSDKDNPRSLRQAMARARREAANLSQWEGSGAPLNDVTVRLSGGEELSLAKRLIANLCGLRIVKGFKPGEVLHVYKKEDRRFGEVLLYSLEVAAISGEEFIYNKTYKNQQTLTLECRRTSAGVFDISVSYTPPVGENAYSASTGLFGIGAVVAPTMLALAGMWFRLRRMMRGDGGAASPRDVFASSFAALALVVAVIGFYEGRQARNPVEPSRAAGAATRSESPEPVPAVAVVSDASKSWVLPASSDTINAAAAQVRTRAGQTGLQAPLPDRHEATAKAGQTASVAVGASCPAFSAVDAHDGANAAAVAPSRAQTALDQRGGGELNAPPLSFGRATSTSSHRNLEPSRRIPIYVTAFVKGDEGLERRMREAIVSALEKTRRFQVWTDKPGQKVPEGTFEVSLEFEPVGGCFGTIYTRLYDKGSLSDGNGKQLWDDAKDCHEYPKATMLTTTSEEIVAKILPIVSGVTHVGRATD
jgi:hypothetical protein